jgi:uncharacterized membrane protein YozB (DUF420 family)
MTVRDLPALNATLNATATVLLFVGWRFILRGERDAHMRCMSAAFAVSVAFLAFYLVYHANVGSVPFPGTGLARAAYLTMLVTHVVLAAIVPPLALITLWRAYRGEFDRHRWIARITFPIWMYVSVTGVLVYVILYWIYGAVAA